MAAAGGGGCGGRRHRRHDRGAGDRSCPGVDQPTKWSGAVTQDGTWTDESDWGAEDFDQEDLEESAPAPVGAGGGGPTVGKSTLVNRILGSREAVVQDVPGVTRDRVSYDANWRGRQFTLVDTGGWLARAQGLAAQVAEQAEIAVGLADAVLFVVDARVGATDEDEAVAR